MNNKDCDFLLREAIHTLLEILVPGGATFVIRPIEGDFANSAHIVEAHSATGSRIRLVVKRYAEFGGDQAEKAHREFKMLALLQNHSVPAPVPLYLDKHGELFGTPGIATSYIPGKPILSTSHPLDCARTLARMLAKIHSIPCDTEAQRFLLDANSEVLWFLRSGVMPDYMSVHPDGAVVWNMVHELLPNIHPVQPTLVHVDYWLGNILWDGGQITAVVDWEEAAYGDAAIDVAYCRMDLFLSGMGWEAADEFLCAYEAEMGRQVANLELWELAATVRPMYVPTWESSVRQELKQFIMDIRRRVGY